MMVKEVVVMKVVMGIDRDINISIGLDWAEHLCSCVHL